MRCFSLDLDVNQALGKIQASFEDADVISLTIAHQAADTSQGTVNDFQTRIIVVDPVTTLFKDTLMPTTAQGMSTS